MTGDRLITVLDIKSALADIRTSLEEQRETDPAPGLEHYIQCLIMADGLLTDRDPLVVKRFKAKCGCGTVVYPHEKYCPECGRKLEWTM